MAEFWTTERLELAMVDEAAGHGASQRDLDQLRAEFKKARANKPPDEGDSRQAGDIPD
jgi:hypothetical protein